MRITGTSSMALAVVLQAAASVCFFHPYYALVTQFVAPSRRHLAVSVVSIAGMFIGGGLIPPLIGYLAEAWSFAGATLLLGAAAFASPGLLLLSSARTSSLRD